MFRRSTFISLGIIVLFSSLLVASSADLKYVDSILDLTPGYYPQGVQLSSDPADGLSEPDYAGDPMYGTIALAGADYAVVIDHNGADGKLYVDEDGSGNLQPVEWIQQLWNGSYLGSATFKISSDGDVRSYRMLFLWDPNTPTVLVYFRGNYREGEIELDGVTYKIAIIDENSDGLFDDLDHDNMFIDTDQDGELLTSRDSHEQHWLDAPFNIHGTVYEATSVSPDGSRIVIDKSDAFVLQFEKCLFNIFNSECHMLNSLAFFCNIFGNGSIIGCGFQQFNFAFTNRQKCSSDFLCFNGFSTFKGKTQCIGPKVFSVFNAVNSNTKMINL